MTVLLPLWSSYIVRLFTFEIFIPRGICPSGVTSIRITTCIHLDTPTSHVTQFITLPSSSLYRQILNLIQETSDMELDTRPFFSNDKTSSPHFRRISIKSFHRDRSNTFYMTLLVNLRTLHQ